MSASEPGLMRLAGPVAYLRRETVDHRRVDQITVPRRFPLTLSRGLVDVGKVTAVAIAGQVVRAEATMATADPVGTRYPCGVNLAPARYGAIVDEGPVMVYREAELLSVDLVTVSAWSDTYLEVIGPCP